MLSHLVTVYVSDWTELTILCKKRHRVKCEFLILANILYNEIGGSEFNTLSQCKMRVILIYISQISVTPLYTKFF